MVLRRASLRCRPIPPVDFCQFSQAMQYKGLKVHIILAERILYSSIHRQWLQKNMMGQGARWMPEQKIYSQSLEKALKGARVFTRRDFNASWADKSADSKVSLKNGAGVGKVANTVQRIWSAITTPERELEPTITTATSAQSRLGMVRIILSSIRVGQSTQLGAMLRDAPSRKLQRIKQWPRVWKPERSVRFRPDRIEYGRE